MAEKSVGFMKIESTFLTSLPSFSDASRAFFQSGSSRKAAQALSAAPCWVGEDVVQLFLALGVEFGPIGECWSCRASRTTWWCGRGSGLERLHLAGLGGVDAQLEHTGVHFLLRGFLLGARAGGDAAQDGSEQQGSGPVFMRCVLARNRMRLS